jgi:hypothetical protein
VFEHGNDVMGLIMAASPHRVFIGRLGRLEVFQPIPAPDSTSPAGPHTHVLPKLLDRRRTHAASEPIPKALVPCAHFYPPHPTKDAMGKPCSFDRDRHVAFQRMLERFGDPGLVALKQKIAAAVLTGLEPSVVSVKKAVIDLKIDYPVAIDNNYAIWRAFNNRYWPAHYFIDAQGRIRHHHFGEGDYAESERVIQQLLVETGHRAGATNLVSVSPSGAEAAPDMWDLESPETYIGYKRDIGYKRAENFVSPGGAVRDMAHVYAAGEPDLNQWGCLETGRSRASTPC